MKMKNKIKVCILICLFFYSFSLYSLDWVIGSEVFTSNKSSQVYTVLGENLPSLILDNLGDSLTRDVTPDEQFERKNFELEKSRLSLFLQLSAEYKKKDNLVLGDYSKKQLLKKQKEADAEIRAVEEKINDNIKEQQELKAESEKKQHLVDSGKYTEKQIYTEGQKWLYLFKNMFIKNESLVNQEAIVFYKNDSTKTFTPSEKAKTEGMESYQFQKEILNEKINTLLTGNITSYGDYLSVNVDAYLFPGCKKIASVMEVGTIKEIEFLASSIAGKLVPYVTNALPLEITVQVSPADVKNLKLYLGNDVINLDKDNKTIIQSGVKTFQVEAEGYKEVAATYNFEGNHKYLIEVTLEPEKDSFIYLKTPPVDNLNVFANGQSVEYLNKEYSRIKINGQNILGQVINADGLSSLYYIPEKSIKGENTFAVKPVLRNTSDYIDKRRKWMYGSYSLLMISLIPSFVTTGEYYNYAGIYGITESQSSYETAKKWAVASDVSRGVSLGCGILFGYELVRYLMAANTVLPKKAKKTDIIYMDNKKNTDNSETIETED